MSLVEERLAAERRPVTPTQEQVGRGTSGRGNTASYTTTTAGKGNGRNPNAIGTNTTHVRYSTGEMMAMQIAAYDNSIAISNSNRQGPTAKMVTNNGINGNPANNVNNSIAANNCNESGNNNNRTEEDNVTLTAELVLSTIWRAEIRFENNKHEEK